MQRFLYTPAQVDAPMYSSGLYSKNTVFEIVYEESVKVYHLHMCVCVFSSHPFWTSMEVPAGVTQEEGHTGFLIHLPSAVRALIFLARRIQPFLSLVDNGNIQQNSLCVESCVTEEFHISPRFSLHLRLPAAVAELAVYAVDEHHAGAALLFSVPTLPFF